MTESFIEILRYEKIIEKHFYFNVLLEYLPLNVFKMCLTNIVLWSLLVEIIPSYIHAPLIINSLHLSTVFQILVSPV